MAKKKNVQRASAKKPQASVKKGLGAATWVAGAVALIAVAAVIATVAGGGSKGAAAGAATSAPAGATSTAGSAPADEQKYIGRLLPASYAEPSVSAASAYTSDVTMSDVTAKQDAKIVSIALSDVTSKKIVYFEYQKAGSNSIPMVAYVKPSGKLFVGVSYCVPCQGKRQNIAADGTLTCASCGTKRDLETGVGISGACRLYPLDEVPATVSGGRIVVQGSVLDGWTSQPLDRPTGA